MKYTLINYNEFPSKKNPDLVYIQLTWISEKLENGNNEALINSLEKSKFDELLKRNGLSDYRQLKQSYFYVDNYFNSSFRSNTCVSFQKA